MHCDLLLRSQTPHQAGCVVGEPFSTEFHLSVAYAYSYGKFHIMLVVVYG